MLLQKFWKIVQCWGWKEVVFALTLLAYVPIFIGGWQHPSDINIATWEVWVPISSIFLYSQVKQDHAGWMMPLGYLIGNLAILALAFSQGGYTFNLGEQESIGFYGITGALLLWSAVGTVTKKWDIKLLNAGGVLADLASFYPMFKQYIPPHEAVPASWVLGWGLFFLAAAVNAIKAECLPGKIYSAKSRKEYLTAINESLLSVEQVIMIGPLLVFMVR